MGIPAGSLDTLCYIREQTSYPEDYAGNFGYQVHDKGNRFYVTFDAVLQSFGVRNRNNREYDLDNIWNLIQTDDYIQSMLRQNSWLGEIDHPAPEKKDEELTVQRIGNPSMEKSSHFIRSPRVEGNLLCGHIQTDSSNRAGMNMAIKIVDGKIIPCFSARVFGSLQNRGGRPVVMVKKLITYDWVLYPSHREALAKINQPMVESVQQMEDYSNCTVIFLTELARMAAASSKETQFLCESFGLTEEDLVGVTKTGNSVVLEHGGDVFVQPISDRNVRARTKSMVTDWLNR
jgi:hypothetical protein